MWFTPNVQTHPGTSRHSKTPTGFIQQGLYLQNDSRKQPFQIWNENKFGPDPVALLHMGLSLKSVGVLVGSIPQNPGPFVINPDMFTCAILANMPLNLEGFKSTKYFWDNRLSVYFHLKDLILQITVVRLTFSHQQGSWAWGLITSPYWIMCKSRGAGWQ